MRKSILDYKALICCFINAHSQATYKCCICGLGMRLMHSYILHMYTSHCYIQGIKAIHMLNFHVYERKIVTMAVL